MRVAGTRSWRFAADDSSLLHTALYVRDSAGLVVEPAADVPPRLRDLAPADDRPDPALGERWLVWWRALVDHEVQNQTHPDATTPERWRSRTAVFDPPNFDSLADDPALRTLVTDAVGPAAGWFGARRHAGAELFPWAEVDAAVRFTADTFGVEPGDVRGAAIVLDVEGRWTLRPGPGVALCSAAVADDPTQRTELLRSVFASGLA